jgi:primase-polymerase (primpol)-like protein
MPHDGASSQVPPKPKALPFAGLPLALRSCASLAQWVAWDYYWKSDREKWDKPPINPHTGHFANHSSPATWGSYDEAARLAQQQSWQASACPQWPG